MRITQVSRTESEKKFLVDTQLHTFEEVSRALFAFGARQPTSICQTYLSPKDDITELRVRKECYFPLPFSQKEDPTLPLHTLTSKKDTDVSGVSVEEETIISEDRYSLFVHSDLVLKDLDPIHKARFRIPYMRFTIEFDVFRFVSVLGEKDTPEFILTIAEVELPDMDIVPEFPFTWPTTEVTHIKEYKNRNIARRALFPGYRTEPVFSYT